MEKKSALTALATVLVFVVCYAAIGWLFDWSPASSLVIGLIAGVGFVVASRLVGDYVGG